VTLPAGRGAYPFDDPRGGGRKVVVHTYRPANFTPDSPIVLCIHGRKRNGADYRDFWIDDAERRGLLIVAPELSEEHYPHPHDYNLGAMQRADGTFTPPQDWLFPLFDRIFEDARRRAGSNRERYFIFGHSAGSQVVHRLVTFAWSDRIEAVIAANAGAYCLPVRGEAFPFGLDGTSLGDGGLREIFSRPVTILLGDRDIDPDDGELPRQPGAMRQGPHRFARGHHYLEVARREALRLGTRCEWRLAIAPGVAHDGGRMVPFAAREFFGAVTAEPTAGN
jgi:poly(3-hydroxybutyrate) depolymerase